jgi:hypothetical protein
MVRPRAANDFEPAWRSCDASAVSRRVTTRWSGQTKCTAEAQSQSANRSPDLFASPIVANCLRRRGSAFLSTLNVAGRTGGWASVKWDCGNPRSRDRVGEVGKASGLTAQDMRQQLAGCRLVLDQKDAFWRHELPLIRTGNGPICSLFRSTGTVRLLAEPRIAAITAARKPARPRPRQPAIWRPLSPASAHSSAFRG